MSNKKTTKKTNSIKSKESIKSIDSFSKASSTLIENDLNKKDINLQLKQKINNKRLIKPIVLNVLMIIICVFLVIFNNNKDIKEELPIDNNKEVINNNEVLDNDYSKYKDIYNNNKQLAYNPDDYKFQLIFDSELINQPIVQGNSNDTYLRKDYITNEYKVEGTCFIDFAVDINNDQNIVIYGHNIPKSERDKYDIRFTMLHELEDKNNYEDNKIIKLVYENKIDYYQVVYVYKVKIVEDDGIQYMEEGEPKYYMNNYTEDEFNNYLSIVKNRILYDTNIDINYDDSLLTLQTCYDTELDKLIVLSKKINTISYN